jgi:hypothetical protein
MSRVLYYTKKKRMLIAMQDNFCNVEASAAQAKINRASHYRWIQHDTEYKKAVIELKKSGFNPEQALLNRNMLRQELKDIMFVLVKRGYSRGYSNYHFSKSIKNCNEPAE